MLKNILKSVGEYKRASLLAPLTVAVEVLLEVSIPLFMAYLIDKGIYTGNMNEIIKYGLILILFATASLTFGILSPGTSPQLPVPALQKIFENGCITKYRIFLFKTLTTFPPPAWSPV